MGKQSAGENKAPAPIKGPAPAPHSVKPDPNYLAGSVWV